MDFFVVVIAGGKGTRFWPLSRVKKPKQFLPIISDKTMIEETIHRLLSEVPSSNIFTIANSEQTQIIKCLLPNIPEENFLVEPQGKNTAPSLMLATAAIYLENPRAVLAVLPADHLIKDSSLFLKKLKVSAAAAAKGEHLITFGIPPTYPSTGYGYIRFSQENPLSVQGENFFHVQGFKEKPDYKQAQTFVEDGNYYWNSGMFLWRAEVFAKKLRSFSPDIFPYWEKILKALRYKNDAKIASIFKEIPSISIDFALMEKAKGIMMCKGEFGWSDVGSWSSLADIWAKDKYGNNFRTDSIVLDSENCLVYNPQKITALIGVKDIIVVNTEDALLICRKDQDQKVKNIVGIIEKKGKIEHL